MPESEFDALADREVKLVSVSKKMHRRWAIVGFWLVKRSSIMKTTFKGE